jgi:uncharacterized protein (DUF2062 family)
MTPAPVGWLERVRRMLRRQSRKVYRAIRHPRQRRRGRIREWLGARIHNRDLWRFSRAPVANGLAGGLFFSMLPLPAQGLFAAAMGIARGWNLPAAIVATWLSNPLTYVPMFLGAKASVVGIYQIFGAEPSIKEMTPSQMSSLMKDLEWVELGKLASNAGAELLLGYLLLGVACALVGYTVVHSLWWLVRHHEDPVRPPRPVRTPRPARRPGLRKQENQA